MANKINIHLFNLSDWSSLNEGLGLIDKLQEFGALPTNPRCHRGYLMKLIKDNSYIDLYKWICKEKLGGQNKKKVNFCNYY